MDTKKSDLTKKILGFCSRLIELDGSKVELNEIQFERAASHLRIINNKEVSDSVPNELLEFTKSHFQQLTIDASYVGDNKPDGNATPDILFSLDEAIAWNKHKNKWITTLSEQYGKEWTEIATNGFAFIHIANGDFIMLDTSEKGNGVIRYFSHEGMGEYSIHGLILANSVEEFFKKWLSIGFCDPINHEKFTNDTLRNTISKELSNWLGYSLSD